MRKTKKIVAMALCIAMVISSFAFTAFADAQAVTTTTADAFSVGVTHDSESAAIPYVWKSNRGTAAKVADPDGSSNNVTKLSDFTSDATIGGVSCSTITAPGDSAQTRFDVYISGFTNKNTKEDENTNGNSVLKVQAFSPGNADEWINNFSIVKTESPVSNVLVTDKENMTIEQNKWYTVIVDHDALQKTLTAKIKERGAADSTAVVANTSVYTTAVTKPINTFYIVTNHGKLANLSELVYYIDNYSINPYVYMKDFASPGVFDDVLSIDGYIAPGFDSADITIGNQITSITDNGTGYYNFTVNLAELDYQGAHTITLNAVYGDSTYSTSKKVDVLTYNFTPLAGLDFNSATVSADSKTVTLNATTGGEVTHDTTSASNTYAIVTGKSGAADDKALQFNVTSSRTIFGWTKDTSNLQTSNQTNKLVKVEFDVKPLDNNLSLTIQHGEGDSNPGNLAFINYVYNGEVTGANTIYDTNYLVKPNEWNHFTLVYDLKNKTMDLYYGDIHCYQKKAMFSSLSSFRFTVKSATSTANAQVVFDNFKYEWANEDTYGVTSYGYTKGGVYTESSLVPLNADSINVKVGADLDANSIKAYNKAGNELAGEVTVTDGTVTYTPAANALKLYDLVSIKITDDMVVTFKVADENGIYFAPVAFAQANGDVKASVSVTADSSAELGNLIVVGYTDNYESITDVNTTFIKSQNGTKVVNGTVTLDADTKFVRAFIWNYNLKPFKDVSEWVVE